MKRGSGVALAMILGWLGLSTGCGPEPTDAVGFIEDAADVTANGEQIAIPSIQLEPRGGEMPVSARFWVNAPAEFAPSLLWEFGDGGLANGLSVEHTFDEPGTFAVTVGTNDQVSAPAFFPVIPDLEIALEPNSTSGAIPWTLGLAAVTVDPAYDLPQAAYDWRLDGRVVAEGANATVTIREAGRYTLGLFVTIGGVTIPCAERTLNADGLPNNSTDPNPIADAGPDLEVAPGSLVILDGTGSSDPGGRALNYEWTQDDGQSVDLVLPTNARSNFIAPSNGTLKFSLAVSNGIAKDTDQVTVRVTDGDPGILSVTSNAALDASGLEGGPFSPGQIIYALENTGEQSLQWQAQTSHPWVDISPANGSLDGGARQNVVVTIGAAAAALDVGVHTNVVAFTNLSNGEGDTNRDVTLTVMRGDDALQVTPEDEQTVVGNVGGPFDPQAVTYTLTNAGSQPIDWSATRTAPWLSVSPASGTLAAGATASVTATVNNNAEALAAGSYSNEVRFANETDDTTVTRAVALNVIVPAGMLAVSPGTPFTSSGPQGGPFSPSVHQYTLSNTGGTPINWTATKSSLWVVISKPSGTLAPGETETIDVNIGVIATTLGIGTHNDSVRFNNTTNGNGNAIRSVSLAVSAPSGALQVSPSGGLAATGNVGGPFTPSSRSFTLTNAGGEPLSWQASKNQAWLTLSATSGTLAPGANATVTATLNAAADGLAAGSYSDTISILNVTSGEGSTSRPVTLTVSEPAALSVSPSVGLTSAGDPGGPFDPDARTYTLANTGGQPLTYQVNKTQNWVSLSRTSGTLPPGVSTTVTVSINGNANALGSGSYADTVAFANLTNGVGDAARAVNLTVNDPPGQMSITPASGLATSGPVGGPFNPVGRQYTLENTGGEAIAWNATPSQTWLSVSPSSGSINPGASTVVTVSVNSGAEALGAGSYSGDVAFSDDAGGSSNRGVTLTVLTPAALAVTPSGPLSSSGLVGGPFTPDSRTYTLTNTGGQPLNFSVSKSAGWVSLSASAGTLAAGATTTVVVSLNGNADALAAGTHTDTVSFTNNTNGAGNATRGVSLVVSDPAALTVSPSGGLSSSGSEGGPFSPNSRTFTLSNSGDQSMTWSASKTRNWVTLSQTSGTLAGGASTTVVATINSNAFGLSAGSHDDTITFTNATNGGGNTTRAVALTVTAPGTLAITPGGAFNSSGAAGGPFSPSSQAYTLTNNGDESLNWTAGDNAAWVSVSPTSGTLAAGASATVTVSLGSAADSLAAGSHSATVTFTNTTNGNGTGTRAVNLTVTGDCTTSTGAFVSRPFTSQGGLFSAEFDVTPNGANIDGLTAFSSGGMSAYSDMAAAVRFNVSGQIDARNGGTYEADNVVNYASGTSYHVRMSINVLTHTYSVYVTPAGGSEQIVAVDYDFRTEQAGVAALDHWTLQSGSGTHDVCNMSIEAGANQAPAVSAGSDASTAMPGASVDLDGTVSDDGLPNPPGAVSVTWSKVSGPGTVNFGSATSVDTQASFSTDGTYVLRLTATDGDESASDDVTITVTPPPPAELEVSTSGLNFGSSSTELTFTVRNVGSGTLSYAISDNASWLSVSPTSGSSTGEADTITVSVNRSGLSDGSHNATITIDPSTGGNQTIAVTMLSGSSAATMSTASRSSGLAPLSVFFDAMTPANGVVQPSLAGGRREYADLYYTWDFGDSGSGNWGTTGKSRNHATGYCAAHVFEDPGTYTVTLTVTNPDTMQESIYTQQVTVTAFSGTTYYVSTSGNDSSNGTSPSTPFRTVNKAMSMAGPNTRILFKRGETWTGGSGITVAAPGPGIIGAYANSDGSDDAGQAKPRIQVTGGGNHGVRFNGYASGGTEDWRVMDLEIVGPGGNGAGDGIRGDGTLKKATLLRLTIRNFYVGILWSYWATDHTENTFADCDISGMHHNGAYYGGSKTAALGNDVDGPTNEHTLRIWYMDRGVYSHNLLGAAPRHQIKLHNDVFANAPTDTQYNVFTDNEFTGGAAWSVTIGPQDEFSNEIIRDTLLDRNTFRSTGNQVQIACVLWARYSTVRNNVFFADGSAPWYQAIAVKQRASEGAPRGNRIFNNTCYRNGSSSEFYFVTVGGSAVDTEIRNNLVTARNCNYRVLISNGGSGTSESNNIMNDNPGYVNDSSGNLRLTAGSMAVDAGTDVGVIRDFDENDRMGQGSGIDVGAFERQN